MPQRVEPNRLSQRLEALGQAAVRVQEALSPEEVLTAVGTQLEALGMRSFFALRTSAEDILVVQHITLPAQLLATAERLLGIQGHGFRLEIESVELLREVIRERRAVLATSPAPFVQAFPRLPLQIATQVTRLLGLERVIAAPLLARGRVLGALIVWGGDPQPDDVPAIVVFAQQAATAYDNALSRERLTRLHAATAALAVAARLDDVARTVTEEFTVALGASGAMLVLLSPDGSMLDLVAASGLPDDLIAEWARFPLASDLPLARAVRSGEPQWPQTAADRAAHYPHLNDLYHRAGPETTWMSIPLRTEGRPTGGLAIRFPSVRLFDAEDRAYALNLSDLCGQAIERAQLFEATRAAERRVSALAEASHAFSAASLSPAAICDTAVHQASASLGDAAAIVLLSNGQRLEVPAVWHPDPAALNALQALLGSLPPDRPVDDTVAGRVVLTDQAVVLNDVHLESTRASLPSELRPYVQQFDIGRILAVPLRVQGRPIGALVLSRSRAGAAYSDDDRAFALDLAGHAALAIDNAQAYDRATHAIRARDEFLSIASHELRTPVAAISAIVQLMHRTRQRGDLDEARLDRALARLTQTSVRLVSLTEDLLDVSRLQTGHFELRLKPIDVGTFVGDLVDQWTAQLTDRHTLSLSASAEQFVVQADPARLEQVVGNVLNNALKYSPGGGAIAVSVGRDGNGVHVEVRDQGIGLPAGAAETIFHPFGRALNAVERQIQGLGLGLYICRQIVERHDGRIWADSPGEGAGTTVHLWLPHTTQAT